MFSLDLQPNEQVFKIYRQTEWVLAKTVVVILLAIYFPWFLMARADLFSSLGKWFLVWIILVFCYGLYHYLIWLASSYIVTDKRLIVVKYLSLFKKQVLESPLARISHISFSTTGFFSSLLNYGNVEVRVMGLEKPLILENLRKPENLKTFLWSLQQAHAGTDVLNK